MGLQDSLLILSILSVALRFVAQYQKKGKMEKWRLVGTSSLGGIPGILGCQLL